MYQELAKLMESQTTVTMNISSVLILKHTCNIFFNIFSKHELENLPDYSKLSLVPVVVLCLNLSFEIQILPLHNKTIRKHMPTQKLLHRLIKD